MGALDRIGFVFARRWIAGRTADEAVRRAKRANAIGEGAILNYLGEAYGRERDVRKSLAVYMRLLEMMRAAGVRGSISVKPTQLGLLEGYAEFRRNYSAIAARAGKLGIFVWVDMEEYRYVDATVRAYLGVLKRRRRTGICLQAKLRRSAADARLVMGSGGSIRIVKGAYREGERLAYAGREEVRRNYMDMLKEGMRHPGAVMVATHDDTITAKARRLEMSTGKRLQFGMLNGIRPGMARELAEEREDVSIYMPFGEEWAGYAARRLREQGHAALLLRSLFQD